MAVLELSMQIIWNETVYSKTATFTPPKTILLKSYAADGSVKKFYGTWNAQN
jgi:hypothetical protein